MNDTNGFHSSSLSIKDNEINGLSKNFKSKNLVNETRSAMKRFDRKQKKKRLEHNDSNNNRKQFQHHLPTNIEHIPSTSSNTNYCHLCGECYGEMIACNICLLTFHPLCMNSTLVKDNLAKNAYFCENCRTMNKTQDDKQQKIILPFSFDPKKNLHLNGFKKNSTLGQIKSPTASNGQSLIQPTGEIKFRATSNNNNNTTKQLSSSSMNLKRKRVESSSPSPPPPALSSSSTINSSNTQLETLQHLFLSSRFETFQGPSILSTDSDNYSEKSCFICRKSLHNQGPSIHCDYCPLIYHLDCLTPPIISLPLSNEKWMCPNHYTPLLDRYFLKKKTLSKSNRIKIYHQNFSIDQNSILQDFTHIKQSNFHYNNQFEQITISQIPKSIQEFYSNIKNQPQTSISKIETNLSEPQFQEYESSFTYDPSVWDILQSILDHTVNNRPYEFSIEATIPQIKSPEKSNQFDSNLDSIDILLKALNEENSTLPPPIKSKSLSDLIDLEQFRLSHAALIHLQSNSIIYLRKSVHWFGLSSLNDICLEKFHYCHYITDRHACLYYDKKRNFFELLNYSPYGTIVNDLHYGLNNNNDYDSIEKNENLNKCFCLSKQVSHSNWDGPAQIEQGTVIQIGCHQFLFYRHIVR